MSLEAEALQVPAPGPETPETGVWSMHPNVLSQSKPPLDIPVDRASWPKTRYKELLLGLFQLDPITVTPKVHALLVSEQGCSALVDFILMQSGYTETEVEDPEPKAHTNGEVTENSDGVESTNEEVEVMNITGDTRYRSSYTAMNILCGKHDDGQLNAEILVTRGSDILASLFQAFDDAFSFTGSLHHVFAVLEHCLARCPGMVYEEFSKSVGHTRKYMSALFGVITFPAASVFATSLMCPSKNIVDSRPKQLPRYFSNLSKWNLLLYLSEQVSKPLKDEEESTKQCVEVIQCMSTLIENYCEFPDRPSSVLLESFKHSPEILRTLTSIVFNSETSSELRYLVFELINTILRLSTKEKLVFASRGVARVVPCKLHDVSDDVYAVVEERFSELCQLAVKSNTGSKVSVKYSSYQIASPFTSLRLQMIGTIVNTATFQPERTLCLIPHDLVRLMCRWFTDYPHCSLYHIQFMKLFVAILKTENGESALLKLVLQKQKLITVCVDTYKDPKKQGNVRGPILYILNCIRLMAASLPPRSYLGNFLGSHATWRAFLPTLEADTLKLTDIGNEKLQESLQGIQEQHAEAWRNASGEDIEAIEEVQVFAGDNAGGINLGSRYADELGFKGVVAYVAPEGTPQKSGKSKSKRRKNKKNKAKDKNVVAES